MSNRLSPHKLIVTILKKGMARSAVQAAKKAGARGATVMLGRGTGIHERRFLGIQWNPEKEVILILVPDEQVETILDALVAAGKLDKPGTGIGFVLDTKRIGGICGPSRSVAPSEHATREVKEMENAPIRYDLIVTIVNKGNEDVVVDASKKAGAEGGTIISGRGTGIHEHAKLFNIPIEPEKNIVLTLIDREKTEAVLEKIMEEAELNKPGRGIAFVMEVERTVGINHALNRMVNEQMKAQNNS
ncbi:P-II family nitrogen regulator [Planifilum fimeticola]